MTNIISIKDLNKFEIINLFDTAYSLKTGFFKYDLSTKTLVNLFFEPSTRTMFSFNAAMNKLNGKTINFTKDTSSIKKGETLTDTIKTMENYGDILVIRHPEKGMVQKLAEVSTKPVINAGDGDGEHPTQALLDLFCICNKFGLSDLPKLKIVLYGDCKHSRTIHSLSYLLDLFECQYYYLPYPNREIINTEEPFIKNEKNITLDELSKINPDVIYCTRMQNERDQGCNIPEEMIINTEFIDCYISKDKIKNNKFLILHPLPRNEELSPELDNTTYAGYFNALELSIYLRAAIINKFVHH